MKDPTHQFLSRYYSDRVADVPASLLRRTCNLALLHQTIEAKPEHERLLLRLRPLAGEKQFAQVVKGVAG